MIGQILKFVRQGFWPDSFYPSVATALTATGSTQATALLVTSELSLFGTVAASTGAILPLNAEPGDELVVVNGGANALSVYPQTGATINGGSANAAFSVAAGKSARFTAYQVTGRGVGTVNWVALLSA